LKKQHLRKSRGNVENTESRNDRCKSKTFPDETVGVIDNLSSVTEKSLRRSTISVSGYPNAVTSEPSDGGSTVIGRRMTAVLRAMSFLDRNPSIAISAPTPAL